MYYTERPTSLLLTKTVHKKFITCRFPGIGLFMLGLGTKNLECHIYKILLLVLYTAGFVKMDASELQEYTVHNTETLFTHHGSGRTSVN